MKKRQWAIIAGFAILALAWWGKNQLAVVPEGQASSRPASVRAVRVMAIQNSAVPVVIRIDGRVSARDKIQLYAEVSGVLQYQSKRFEIGQNYRQGESILALDDREARSAERAAFNDYLSLLSQVLPDIQLDYPEQYPQWRDYLEQTAARGEAQDPPVSEAGALQLFLTGRGLYSRYQNWRSAAVRLAKYRLLAPFDGSVSQSAVEPGSLVRSGQLLGEFMGGQSFDLETSVSPSEISLFKEGDSVHFEDPLSGEKYHGRVARKTRALDPMTQRVRVQLELSGPGLYDGQYLSAAIEGGRVPGAFALERKLLQEEKAVFIVRDSVLHRQVVEVVHRSPEQVIVRGLPEGSLLCADPLPGAYEGQLVKIIERL